MPKTKAKKQTILKNLEDKLAQMKSAVFVNFSGIPVKEITKLRSKGRKENVSYTTAKKTLLKKALVSQGFATKTFSGEVAVLFGLEDEVAPSRLVSEFAKEHEKMKILGGILEGQFIEEDKIIALAKLPGRQELLSKLVGSMAAPLSGMVNVLQGNLRSLVYVLNAISQKK